MNRGVLYGWAGEIEAAETDTCNGHGIFERLGHSKRAADLRHNLAWLAGRRGDLVEAFRRFDDAERDYHELGMSSAAIFPDRSEVLLAAGLTREALALAERAVDDLRAAGDDVDVAEASILVARAALLVVMHSVRQRPARWRHNSSHAKTAAAGGRPPHHCTSNPGCGPASPTSTTCGGSMR